MLTLTRKTNESIIITPAKEIDTNMTVSELFNQGPIEIRFNKIRHDSASVSIQAPRVLELIRSELLEET